MSNDKSPTKIPPSKGGGKGVTCNVVLLDGETLEVPLDKNDVGRALFDKVCQHLDLIEKDYFGFTYQDDRGPSHLKYWLNLDKKISKVKKPGGAWVFDFSLKFYPPDPAQLRESLTRWLVVLQIRRDLLSGRIPCTFTTYALLGSYNVQAELGEFDPSDHGSSNDYIRNMSFSPHQNPELLDKIVELHRQHKGQTPDEAEKFFLDNAKKLSMYGIDLHKAKDADNNAVMLGVCCSGLLIYRDKLRINRFVWPKILKLSYKRHHFYIKIRPGELERGEATIMFKLDTHRLAKRMWKTCVEHHAFFRLRESENSNNSVNFPRFGSKFRYSGRTLYQQRQTAALLDRPPPFFERTNSRNSYEDTANRSKSVDDLGNSRTKRLMSTDSRDSSMYGGDTLNRTREYNLADDADQYANHDYHKDAYGNTLQKRPYDSLDRRDTVPGKGDALDTTADNTYDSGFMPLNGDKEMLRNGDMNPVKYRYNKDGGEYPHGYPIDFAGREFPHDKYGNKYPNGKGVATGKQYRFDNEGREFPQAFPHGIDGKEYSFDKDGNRYPEGKDGNRYRFDKDGREYPFGYPYDKTGKEYAYDQQGKTYPYGIGAEKFGYDSDGKRYRFDKDGNEYLQGFPYDQEGKEYPYDADGNKFPSGGEGQGCVFDHEGKEYPLAFPLDINGKEYPYDKDGNLCPTDGYRFDKVGKEFPHAYPFDTAGVEYPYDSDGNRYPQGKDGKDKKGYVYDKDGKKYKYDKYGREFPSGVACDSEGVEYPFNKQGMRYPLWSAASSAVNGSHHDPTEGFRFDKDGKEYPHAYPFDSAGVDYPFDSDGNRYPQGKDGKDKKGYVYDKDGKKYKFDKYGREFPVGTACDSEGVEYPFNKEGMRYSPTMASSSAVNGTHYPAEGFRFDKAGKEYPLAYPFDSQGNEYSYDSEGNRYPQGKDGKDKKGYIYDKDGKKYKFDKYGREYPGGYPFDDLGAEYPYNKDGLRYPTDLATSYDVDGRRFRYDQIGTEFPHGYPHDKTGLDYPYDEEGNRCPYEGYHFDGSGKEFPHGYPFDEEGKAYCYDRDGKRFPVTKDGADRLGYVYDRDGKRYRFDKDGNEYPYYFPLDSKGKEYCYDKDGSRCPDGGFGKENKPNGHDLPDSLDTIDPRKSTEVSTLPYDMGLGMGQGDFTGVVGQESQVDNTQKFVPLPSKIKESHDSLTVEETKDTIKVGNPDDAMPFFQPSATSTVGRSKGPPPPVPPKKHSMDDSSNRKGPRPPVPPKKHKRDSTSSYKTQRDGVEETRMEQKVTISGLEGDDDFDFDNALAEAIRSVTEFNPDMSVERIECVQQIEDVKDSK